MYCFPKYFSISHYLSHSKLYTHKIVLRRKKRVTQLHVQLLMGLPGDDAPPVFKPFQ